LGLTVDATTSGPGALRTYLGTAPGVGKTYAMLDEAHRRAEGGERVVVGWLERHGRTGTRARLGDLEMIAPRAVVYRGTTFPDLDVDAVVESGADVVLVDELAHTVVNGSRQRWEDVADIVLTGMDVMTTVNVANLQSVRDYAARITGAGTVESVPDEFVRSGDVVLVDLPADLLRQRIASGKVYSAEAMGGALAEYFRPANLEALRVLGQAWLADTVATAGEELLVARGLSEGSARPVVVAGVSDSAWGESVIRQAVQLAAEDDADLVVVHVDVRDGFVHTGSGMLDHYRDETRAAGGTFTVVQGPRPADGIADLARGLGATKVVVARHRSRLGELARGSVPSRLRRLLPGTTVVDVRVELSGREETQPS
jgi:two-component system sensor histidine kinase KdpD